MSGRILHCKFDVLVIWKFEDQYDQLRGPGFNLWDHLSRNWIFLHLDVVGTNRLFRKISRNMHKLAWTYTNIKTRKTQMTKSVILSFNLIFVGFVGWAGFIFNTTRNFTGDPCSRKFFEASGGYSVFGYFLPNNSLTSKRLRYFSHTLFYNLLNRLILLFKLSSI